MQRMHIARNLQTKIVSLTSSLASGLVGSGEQGMGGTPITPEQRSAIDKELAESRCAFPVLPANKDRKSVV